MANETVLPDENVTSLSATGHAVAVGWGREGEEASLQLSTAAPQRGVGLILYGYAPTLGGVENSIPSAGTLSLSGKTVQANVDHFPSTAESSLGLTGHDVTITVDHIRLPAVEPLVLSGKLPVAVAPTHHIALPAAKPLTLFGFEPIRTDSSDPNDLVVPDTGSAVFAGQAPVSSNTSDIFGSPADSSMLLTGFAPVLVRAARRLPAAGTLTLTGAAVVVPIGEETAPTEVGLLLASVAPVLQQTMLQLVLEGQAPAVVASGVATPAAGALVLSPQDVVNANAVQSVPLALTGHAPTVTFSSFFADGKGNLIYLTIQRDVIFIAAPSETLID